MGAVNTVGWMVLTMAVTFWIVWRRAIAEIRRIRAEEQRQTAHWRAEAERARLKAIRLRLEIEAYKAGHAQGRDDGITVLRLMTAAGREPADSGSTGADPVRGN